MTATLHAADPRVASRDPVTGLVWRTYPVTTPEEVDAAVARARDAQRAWATRPEGERVRLLDRFHDALYDRRAEVVALLTRENGKPAADGLGSEVVVALDLARFYAQETPRALRPRTVRPSSLAMWRKRVRITHEPYGVVGVIAPWNYPFMLAVGVILPALAAGNAVVLKPSELTPAVGLMIGELLAQAGAPPDLVAVLPGDGTTGAALCAADVDKVFFVGSVATGRKVAEACARRLVPCVLELGGSDPALVLADADVPHAAVGIAWGRFSNAGQTCTAPKRVYVHERVYDRFVDELARAVRALRVGPGSAPDTDVGPLIRPEQAEALRGQRDEALARGARVVAEAQVAPHAASVEGAFFAPTVLADVPPDARVLIEETFGPLLPVVRVGSDEEAVRLANASAFGLSASVWSTVARHAHAVAASLEAGTVALNDAVIVAGVAEVPHGGVKASGMGRSHGLAGLLECVRTKTIVEDRFAAWAQPWWFGGHSGERAADLDAFAQLAHGRGLGARLRGLPGTARLVLRRPTGSGRR